MRFAWCSSGCAEKKDKELPFRSTGDQIGISQVERTPVRNFLDFFVTEQSLCLGAGCWISYVRAELLAKIGIRIFWKSAGVNLQCM
jgi:hypothetical protein